MVDKENWLKVLKEINDSHTIEGEFIKFNDVKSLIYHQYSVGQILGPNDSETKVNVDHIIPQAFFERSSINNQEYIKNSLFNLCLLPSKENIKKGDRPLDVIKDKWLIDQIEKYAHIVEKDFSIYSNVKNWENLRKNRRSLTEEIFIDNRDNILNN